MKSRFAFWGLFIPETSRGNYIYSVQCSSNIVLYFCMTVMTNKNIMKLQQQKVMQLKFAEIVESVLN